MRRERHNLSMVNFPSALHHVQHPAENYWSGLGEPRKSTFFLRDKNSSHCFFSNPQNPRPTLPVHDVIHIPGPNSYLGFLLWHLWMTHPLARVWTHALMLYLINPCSKRKILILTKPKDKIYKTKSLRHYNTLIGFLFSKPSNFFLI